jgi:hypothetical protein
MNWILHPLTLFVLLAAGLALCLYLFISLKQENALLQRRLRDEHASVAAAVESFRSSLLHLQCAVAEQDGSAPPFAPVPASLNFNKRSQALRMYRRGEATEKICAALQMPRNEVELLFKVHHAGLGEEAE